MKKKSFALERAMKKQLASETNFISLLDYICPTNQYSECMHKVPSVDIPFVVDKGHISLAGYSWILSKLRADKKI